jgi:hypothetical protein
VKNDFYNRLRNACTGSLAELARNGKNAGLSVRKKSGNGKGARANSPVFIGFYSSP